MQNMAFGPYLAANNRILIPLMTSVVGFHVARLALVHAA
jgi:hypothetical protein